jgi:hypothetical protein
MAVAAAKYERVLRMLRVLLALLAGFVFSFSKSLSDCCLDARPLILADAMMLRVAGKQIVPWWWWSSLSSSPSQPRGGRGEGRGRVSGG